MLQGFSVSRYLRWWIRVIFTPGRQPLHFSSVFAKCFLIRFSALSRDWWVYFLFASPVWEVWRLSVEKEGGRGAFCHYSARHSVGGEEMTPKTPEQIDSGKSLCHRSLEHLNSRHNSLRSRLSNWSHRSAVTKGDKSNGDDGGVSWYALSACSVPLLVDLFQTPTAGSPGTTGTVWHFLTWGHFSESLRATDSSEPHVQRWLMGSQRAVVGRRK